MEEIWKPVLGFEGCYEVSNLGKVRSLDRRTKSGRLVRGVLLKLGYRVGYPCVTLYANNVPHKLNVHSLVAEAFLGPRPEGLVVDHLDGVRSNSIASNLEYVTVRENTLRGRSSLKKKGVKCPLVGVTVRGERFVASKRFGAKLYHIGTYPTAEEAHQAYLSFTENDIAALKLRRENEKFMVGVSYVKTREAWFAYHDGEKGRKSLGYHPSEEAARAYREEYLASISA